MLATWTCICGKTFHVEESRQGKLVTCPLCDFVLGEALPPSDVPSTTVQADKPTPRTVLADPEILIQAGEPVWRGPTVVDEELKEPDIRVKNRLRGVVLSILLAGAIGASIPLGLAFVPNRPMDAGPSETALMQAKALTQVCDAYKIKHQKFPDTLVTLLVKDEFGIIWMEDPTKLIDPWGRPYQYDAAGPRNEGLHPDIWSDAPDGTRIGNWPKKAP